MKKGKAYIGTSGWKYPHWENKFYPADLKKKDQLGFFTEKFSTVELNNSFYRQPTPKNFADWERQVPAGFVYSVKANRYFTHLKKLNVKAGEIENFLSAAESLKHKLGPILFQLPPKWNINVQRLSGFLNLLPKGFRYTFEFRNTSWYQEEVYALLKEHNCAFCIYELAGHQSPVCLTADFVYIRLHGPGEKYQGSYSTDSLMSWAELCRKWMEENKDVYIYFDNDDSAYAAENALELKKILMLDS